MRMFFHGALYPQDTVERGATFLVRQSSSDIAKLLKPLAPWIPSGNSLGDQKGADDVASFDRFDDSGICACPCG
jgi:hypothetical protein